MKTYIEIFKKSFLSEYIYRGNTIIKIIRNFFVVFISASIWTTLLKNNAAVTVLTLNEMLNYIIISYLIQNLVTASIADLIANKVRQGSLVMDFCKPIRFNFYLFAYQFGKNIFNVVFSSIPVLIVCLFIFRIKLVAFSLSMSLFFVSMFLGMIIMFYLQYAIGLLAFWLKSAVFVRNLLSALFIIFGGGAIPLWFYPQTLLKIGSFMPFRYITFDPIRIYLGKLNGQAACRVIAMQLFWILLVIIIERILWHFAQKVVTVQGG